MASKLLKIVSAVNVQYEKVICVSFVDWNVGVWRALELPQCIESDRTAVEKKGNRERFESIATKDWRL